MGLWRRSGFHTRDSQTAHDVLIGKVGDGPVDLARLENAVVPRAPVGVGTEAFDPEVPKIPELESRFAAE